MSLSKDPIFLRNIIIENYDNPNKKINNLSDDSGYIKLQNKSSTCIDDITVYIKTNNEIIENLLFSGIGCAISTSSTNIVCNLLVGKNIKDAFIILDNYLKMVDGQNYDEELLDELIAFHKISEQTNRIKCATIGINAIYNCLKNIK